jgi:hypothetical protein
MTGKKLQTRYLRLVRSGAGREDRMAARKAYRTMVRSKKRQHKLKQVEELCRLDPSSFWKRYRGPRKPLRLRDISMWYSHYSKLLSAGVTLPGNASETIDSTAGMEVSNRLFYPHGAATLNEPFSGQEVEQAIIKMNNDKAAGNDGI